MTPDLTLKNSLLVGAAAVVAAVGMVAIGGAAEPIAAPLTAAVTNADGSPLADGATPPVSVSIENTPDGGNITITGAQPGPFGVVITTPPYADGTGPAPVLIAGQVVLPEDTVLTLSQTS